MGMGMEKRMRRNPLARPSATMSFAVRKGALPGVVEVYLYDTLEIDTPERALVGGMMLTSKAYRGAIRWETTGVVACSGFGPLVYDIAALVVHQRIYASRDQSEAAKAFWKRQGKRYLDPLIPSEFQEKYGISARELFLQGFELTEEDFRRMADALTVFFDAKEAEKAGKPVTLPRCALVNGRRR